MTAPILALGDVVRPVTERTKMPGDRHVGLEHLTSGWYVLSGTGRQSAGKGAAFVFAPGDILYGRLRPNLDKVIVAQKAGTCSTEFIVLRSTGILDSRYIVAALHSPAFVTYAVAGIQGAVLPRVKWEHLQEFHLAAPSADVERLTCLLHDSLVHHHQHGQTLAAMLGLLAGRAS